MKSFKEFILEQKEIELLVCGGNVQIGDREAQRIDLTKFSRDEIVPVIRKGLKAISDAFKSSYGLPIWDDDLFTSNKYLSGSAFHFFDTAIPSTLFVSKKPTVGDIDTQVDIAMTPQIKQFLDKSEGKTFETLT